MTIQFVITGDGTATLFSEKYGDVYHSLKGPIAESEYVFVRQGLGRVGVRNRPVDILEVGFGTGLNALLTALACGGRSVRYEAFETDPLPRDVWRGLNYAETIGGVGADQIFEAMHTAAWNQPVGISREFVLTKRLAAVESLTKEGRFDCIYFDAFSPGHQPEIWSESILGAMFRALRPGGVWVSYCAKGEVRRRLERVGFTVERLPGPPGKREMLRAIRPDSAGGQDGIDESGGQKNTTGSQTVEDGQ